jgi:hypothetical protein
MLPFKNKKPLAVLGRLSIALYADRQEFLYICREV